MELPRRRVLVSVQSTCHSLMLSGKSLKEEFSRSDWAIGMPAGHCLGLDFK